MVLEGKLPKSRAHLVDRGAAPKAKCGIGVVQRVPARARRQWSAHRPGRRPAWGGARRPASPMCTWRASPCRQSATRRPQLSGHLMSSAPLRGGRAGGTAAVGASGPAVPPGAAAGKRGRQAGSRQARWNAALRQGRPDARRRACAVALQGRLRHGAQARASGAGAMRCCPGPGSAPRPVTAPTPRAGRRRPRPAAATRPAACRGSPVSSSRDPRRRPAAGSTRNTRA